MQAKKIVPDETPRVRAWAHVRLFSPWAELVDPAAEKLLAPTGWTRPDAAAYPSGGDWAERYLQPLADVLGARVRYNARVTGVARAGRDRLAAMLHGENTARFVPTGTKLCEALLSHEHQESDLRGLIRPFAVIPRRAVLDRE